MGRPEFLNRRWREYTGLDLGQPSETTWRAAIHPDDLPQWLEHWRSVSTSSEPWELELRLRRFDGVYRWFLCRASPQTDASSQIVRWCGINTDIDDDRRRAESDLRTIETNFSGWVESFPGLMVTMNTAGEVKLFSQEVLEYFGKTREELRNWAMTDAVHPDDLQRVVAAFTESVTTGKPYSIDHRCRRADGVYRWFQVRALAVRDADEQITGWYVVLVDIDDVKRAEAELRRAHNSFADAQRLSKTGSFITDLVAEDHNWSEEAYRIFEFETESKVTVQRIRDIIHPDDLPSFDSVIARGMSGVNVDFAFRIVTARGAVKHVRGIAHVVEQVEGRPMFVGALQDVTESMVAEEALNKARSELAHVSRITTVSALTASIAHEVNQPLAAIITNASTCLRMLNRDPPEHRRRARNH
jgi:PAS domain S-box-containing protein